MAQSLGSDVPFNNDCGERGFLVVFVQNGGSNASISTKYTSKKRRNLLKERSWRYKLTEVVRTMSPLTMTSSLILCSGYQDWEADDQEHGYGGYIRVRDDHDRRVDKSRC